MAICYPCGVSGKDEDLGNVGYSMIEKSKVVFGLHFAWKNYYSNLMYVREKINRKI